MGTGINLVLAFSGRIASGKSHLSTSVSAALGWPRVSFGDYVRAVARQRHLDTTRRSLQTLGEAIIVEKGWENYCRSVLAQIQWRPGQSLVVDGVRHAEALHWLKCIVSPLNVILVLLEVDEASRKSRLKTREGQLGTNLEQLDLHSTEVQVTGVLKNLADLVLDSTEPVSELTSKVVRWIRQRSEP